MDKKAFQNIQKKLGLTVKGVSEALDVELFTVHQWASGIWPVPRPIAKFLRTLLTIEKDNEVAYRAGHTQSYNEGRRFGREEERLTRVEGYTVGYDEGYIEGLAVGRREGRYSTTDYSEGYIQGQDIGRRAGYSEGYAAAMS